ncbi:MAG TPA: DUF349 domain-containing protein [Paludibacter sp.]|nr:DUF349 domain-containing protein [Paludibacter sp.]
MNPLDLNKETEIVSTESTVVEVQPTVAEVQAEVVEAQPEVVEVQPTVAEVQPEVVEVQPTVENTIIDQSEATDLKNIELSTSNKKDLISQLKLLIEQDVEVIKNEVESIKQVFYKKVKAEHDELKRQLIEAEGEEAEYIPQNDAEEEEFKSLLNEYRIKKASHTALLEKEKENNLIQKQHIIAQLKGLVESNDDVSTHINEFRELQKKWKTIGQVPPTATTELWKQFNVYQESFWDLLKINNELREYDFRKNLEAKTLIIEAAEKLENETDIISAFHQLQKLHDEWHELGPVSRELRDQIWNRFKEASTIINKKHQTYFDEIRKLEENNLQAKNALCEKIESFDYSKLNNYKAWDDATVTVIAWQDEWRSIGFAPRKINQKLFDRYRKACDGFFEAKAEFYKASKNVLSQNYEKKKALCEQAEELKNTTDWKESSNKLIQMQKEWKTTGPVAKKYSDELWKRFITACDYFFEQKNKSTSGLKNVEAENLTKKKELIEKIEAIDSQVNTPEALLTLREYIAEWNTLGHVPFKEKDKIYKEYRTAIDKQFEKLNVDASQRRLDSFKNNLKDMTSKGENKLYREREKLVRAYEHLKSEIATYENNIGFFSSNSKKGGGLIKDMERKIEALKEESKLIEQKINLIEENL